MHICVFCSKQLGLAVRTAGCWALTGKQEAAYTRQLNTPTSAVGGGRFPTPGTAGANSCDCHHTGQGPLTMASGTSSPACMSAWQPSCLSSREDMVTARFRPRLSRMKGVLAPLPDPGAPFSHTISLGVCQVCTAQQVLEPDCQGWWWERTAWGGVAVRVQLPCGACQACELRALGLRAAGGF